MKMNCKPSILDKMRNFEKTKSPLVEEWVKVIDL